MLRLTDVKKSYGARDVLSGVDWNVTPRSRVGLVGRNGSGKTTVLRLIAGLEEIDAGGVDLPRDATIGYLPQEGARLAEGTVLAALLSFFPEVSAMESELERLHEEMASASGSRLQELTHRAGDVQHRFEAAGGFRLETEARRILTGLGFAVADHHRPLAEMSGGYRMRAALGALLLKAPDYLLLDEPTNHLDLDAVAWLEEFLQASPSALIVVSHDRVFLNRLVGSIADLERGRVTVYAGNYDRYRVEKEAARDRQRAAAAQEAHRVGEIERFVERFRYKATKARQVQSRIKMLEKMQRTQVDPNEKTWRFELPPAPRSAQRVIRLSGVVVAFDGRRVLGDVQGGVSIDLYRGERLALVGPNGSGKSTMLKVAAGLLPPDEGEVIRGDSVVMHYFAQHVLESLTSGRTVLEEMQAWAPGKTPGELRSLLGIFQFSGDDVFKRVDVLSGGEKNRLAMARLMRDPGNLLLLDEPTNHLDLPAREALEGALARYDGTLIFVSHDRYFINQVATKVAGISSGRLRLHEGGYDAWRAWQTGEAAAGAAGPPAKAEGAAGSGEVRADKAGRKAQAEARNARNKALRDAKARVAKIESDVAAAEHRIDEIDAQLADPSTYQDGGAARTLGEEKKKLQASLSRLQRMWEEVFGQVSDLEREPPAAT